MSGSASNLLESVGGFPIQGNLMRYNLFMPRLYNWCKALGFEVGKIMPSRAFCSDENQGYPIIMIGKHFGTFPFNHGRVGGIVATDRHGPHSDHGQDLVIIQASHVGYDPQSKNFGTYRRLQTTHQTCGPSCGKLHRVIDWYQNKYHFAQQNILLHKHEGQPCIIIDNTLLQQGRDEGLFLNIDSLIKKNNKGQDEPIKNLGTSSMFTPSNALLDRIGAPDFSLHAPQAIDNNLDAEMFFFRRNISQVEEGTHHLEFNLMQYMPQIMTARAPLLIAAQINTQIEFDRTVRNIAREKGYQGKKVLFIAGLNIDISPQLGQLFPLTKFVPWAAYIKDPDGRSSIIQQSELVKILEQQSIDNPDQIDLEDAIQIMAEAEEVKLQF